MTAIIIKKLNFFDPCNDHSEFEPAELNSLQIPISSSSQPPISLEQSILLEQFKMEQRKDFELIVRKIKFKLFKTLDDKIEKIETFAFETATFIEIWQNFIHDYKGLLEKLPEKKNKNFANILIFNSEQAKGILQNFYEVYSYFFIKSLILSKFYEEYGKFLKTESLESDFLIVKRF